MDREANGPPLEDLLSQLESRDPLVYEGAYHLLAPRATELLGVFLERLSAASDGYTRCKYLELIGESGNPRAIPVLAIELGHADQNVRQWAITGLQQIGTPAALALVEAYQNEHPDEFA